MNDDLDYLPRKSTETPISVDSLMVLLDEVGRAKAAIERDVAARGEQVIVRMGGRTYLVNIPRSGCDNSATPK